LENFFYLFNKQQKIQSSILSQPRVEITQMSNDLLPSKYTTFHHFVYVTMWSLTLIYFKKKKNSKSSGEPPCHIDKVVKNCIFKCKYWIIIWVEIPLTCSTFLDFSGYIYIYIYTLIYPTTDNPPTSQKLIIFWELYFYSLRSMAK
jgi:hypothetical protein